MATVIEQNFTPVDEASALEALAGFLQPNIPGLQRLVLESRPEGPNTTFSKAKVLIGKEVESEFDVEDVDAEMLAESLISHAQAHQKRTGRINYRAKLTTADRRRHLSFDLSPNPESHRLEIGDASMARTLFDYNDLLFARLLEQQERSERRMAEFARIQNEGVRHNFESMKRLADAATQLIQTASSPIEKSHQALELAARAWTESHQRQNAMSDQEMELALARAHMENEQAHETQLTAAQLEKYKFDKSLSRKTYTDLLPPIIILGAKAFGLDPLDVAKSVATLMQTVQGTFSGAGQPAESPMAPPETPAPHAAATSEPPPQPTAPTAHTDASPVDPSIPPSPPASPTAAPSAPTTTPPTTGPEGSTAEFELVQSCPQRRQYEKLLLDSTQAFFSLIEPRDLDLLQEVLPSDGMQLLSALQFSSADESLRLITKLEVLIQSNVAILTRLSRLGPEKLEALRNTWQLASRIRRLDAQNKKTG